MFTIIGIVVVLAAVIVGYTMHGGNMAVLIQINELIILGGAGFGSFLAANGMKNVQAAIKSVMGLLKPDPYTKPAYLDLLKMMYQLFNVARKEGLLGLERHIEEPEKSDIMKNYPTFLANHHAMHFLCDTMKVGRIWAIATAACRDADNGRDFITAAQDICGVKIEVLSGKLFDGSDPEGAVIERSLARYHGFALGDRIQVTVGRKTYDSRIDGIVSSPEYLVTTANPEFLVPERGSFGVVFSGIDRVSDVLGFTMVNDLLFRWRSGWLPINIPAIVSNHPDYAELAASYGIPFHHLPLPTGSSAARPSPGPTAAPAESRRAARARPRLGRRRSALAHRKHRARAGRALARRSCAHRIHIRLDRRCQGDRPLSG